ncbi:MAG: benzoate-CoA ligase family protein [Planctomycetes bacterium]|nr:benzoate-CoA ligase family protein [Planctomycetota bacterium]
MPFEPPEEFNIADYYLDARIREGRGDRIALVCGDRRLTYREVQSLANRFGNVLRGLGANEEERILVALPDGPEFVGALFGILKLGAVVVMVNPGLRPEEIAYFYEYTRARIAIVHAETMEAFAEAAKGARRLRRLLVVGGVGTGGVSGDGAGAAGGTHASFAAEAARVGDTLENAPTHRDDAAIWLFSGGTTGRPKAVLQTHASFANTTELYAKGVLDYRETDVTLSVPKLFFGYATGSNLFFPFAVGGTSVLFPERCTADALFGQIAAHRPTILINVPTMVNQMVSHPEAARQDLSCLRLATSAGEALPPELYDRWKAAFGVELLDGLGTAEMWHVFLTNRLGDVRPGTLGRAVPGFDVRVCDDDGGELPAGEVGALWVRGRSRAIGYWQQMERTAAAFRGEWYVTGDMVSRDAEGYFTYAGRGDDLLKVGGKWVAPAEVENCLLGHPSVRECAVVGVPDENGLTKPHAFVVARELPAAPGLPEELQAYVKAHLDPYKYPRKVILLDTLPRTHLGKVDRAGLRRR